MTRFALLAVLAALFCPAAASAQGLELSVAPITTADQPVRIGDLLELDVTLKNSGEAAATNLTTLTFDRQSLSMELAIEVELPPTEGTEKPRGWSKTFRDERIHGEYGPSKESREVVLTPEDLGTFELAPGASQSARLTLPLLRATPIKVVVVYRGGPTELRSEPLIVKPEPWDGRRDLLVRMLADRGEVVMKLYPEKALGTCNNFVRLIKEGFYNGLTFHRIVTNFMMQGGCPKGTGTGGPGYYIPAEINDSRHLFGRVAMARSSHFDSAGSQFYICFNAKPSLDGQYTVFGEVISGKDVVNIYGETETTAATPQGEASTPVETQRIRSISITPLP